MADATGPGVLYVDLLLVGDRRESGELVENAGHHPRRTGVDEWDGSILGIGLGPQIDYDLLPAAQTLLPLTAQTEKIQLACKANPEIRGTAQQPDLGGPSGHFPVAG